MELNGIVKEQDFFRETVNVVTICGKIDGNCCRAIYIHNVVLRSLNYFIETFDTLNPLMSGGKKRIHIL